MSFCRAQSFNTNFMKKHPSFILPRLPFPFKWSLLCPEDRHSWNEGGVLLWRLGSTPAPPLCQDSPWSSPSGTPVGRRSARTASSHSPARCFLLSLWYILKTTLSGTHKVINKKILISIKTYKPCSNPLKQLKTAPSSLQLKQLLYVEDFCL